MILSYQLHVQFCKVVDLGHFLIQHGDTISVHSSLNHVFLTLIDVNAWC